MLGGGGAAGPAHTPRPVVHPPTRPEVGLALPGYERILELSMAMGRCEINFTIDNTRVVRFVKLFKADLKLSFGYDLSRKMSLFRAL